MISTVCRHQTCETSIVYTDNHATDTVLDSVSIFMTATAAAILRQRPTKLPTADHYGASAVYILQDIYGPTELSGSLRPDSCIRVLSQLACVNLS